MATDEKDWIGAKESFRKLQENSLNMNKLSAPFPNMDKPWTKEKKEELDEVLVRISKNKSIIQ